MKNSQTRIWEHPINNVEIILVQVSSEQLINVLQTSLTPNLEIAACQQLIKILPRKSMAESRSGKDHIH